jgi:hypothetical protein
MFGTCNISCCNDHRYSIYADSSFFKISQAHSPFAIGSLVLSLKRVSIIHQDELAIFLEVVVKPLEADEGESMQIIINDLFDIFKKDFCFGHTL